MANKRGSAAYAPEDVEDAKRGAPAVSLESWATARGLEYVGRALIGAFVTVLPRWVDYVFNVGRGPVAGGRFGQVAHELEEIETDEGGLVAGGGFFGVRTYSRKGLLYLVGIDKAPPDEPFATPAAWVPTTKVILRVPEAALLPRISIRQAGRMGFVGNPELDDGGLPGFRMAGSRWVSDELRLAVAAAARPLAEVGAPFVALTLDHGLLAVRRNGFVADPGALDVLVDATGRIAEALVEVARPLTAPQPFSAPLPPPDRSTWPPGFWQPMDHEVEATEQVASQLGFTPEDAAALHRAQPGCPVPGLAFGVARGTLAGTAGPARVAFFAQGGQVTGSYRTAVLVPARPGAATPVGGHRHEPTDLYVEVVDEIAYGWPRTRTIGGLDSAATVARAVTTFRELGLADL